MDRAQREILLRSARDTLALAARSPEGRDPVVVVPDGTVVPEPEPPQTGA